MSVAVMRLTEHLLLALPAEVEGASLQLYVVFTNLAATRRALQIANSLAYDLGARLTLLVAQVVPYPLPLECPAVCIGFTEQILSELASQVEADITVNLYLCRDRNEAIREALRPGSIVVIGSRKRWWPNKERILARLLRRDGHNVVVIEANRFQTAEICSTKARTRLSEVCKHP